ncbi:vomeronasal type-2 receptor 26-like [Protopterus annectens]|uniref:vomeronasal type-2 receptor 26-like n=1 Tax=Protopterus annectens TaxID=7888 RepID=UPI001CFB21D7|nr:vomeronasal type-2 receptor 26-like [Protopterus annectens]
MRASFYRKFQARTDSKRIRKIPSTQVWTSINLQAELKSVQTAIREKIPRSVCSEDCPLGHRKRAKKGEPPCCFDCIPCSLSEIANRTGSSECINCPEDEWPSERHDKCIPKLTEFLTYDEPLGTSIATTAIFFSLITASVLCIFIKYRDTPIVKANNRELSYLLLVSITLCFLSSLTFIGQPVKTTCIVRQTFFGIIFSFCISSVLAKTITVIAAFNATKPNSKLKDWVGHKIPISVVLFCCVIQVIICSVWLACSPPFPELNTKSENKKIILECNEGRTILFYCMLGYLGFLAFVSFLVAYFARTLPDTFNEARYITFSMLIFLSVQLTFIPAYISTQGKYTVAVEIFAILSSSIGLLSCIFFNKCYIILLRPEKNTKRSLTGKKI